MNGKQAKKIRQKINLTDDPIQKRVYKKSKKAFNTIPSLDKYSFLENLLK